MSTAKQNPWLQRYAVFVAVCTLFLILVGAIVTSSAPAVPVKMLFIHRILAFGVTALTFGLAIWLVSASNLGSARQLGWLALGLAIAEVGLGEASAVQRSAAVGMNFSHALLAHLLFATGVAAIVFASQSWAGEPELVQERFSIRGLSLAAPFVVLAQIALGAAYRHKAMGVIMHIFGAMIVAVFILLVGVLAVKQYPTHRALRPAAIWLMSIAGAQVLLGFAAFVARLMTDQPTPAVVVITVAHVVTGALTLAVSVILAIQIGRNVRAASPGWPEPRRAKAVAP